MGTKTVLGEVSGDLLVVVNGGGALVDEELATLIEQLAPHPEVRKVMVFTRGASPSSRQRELVAQAMKGREIPKVALMTDSVVVRGAVKVMSLMMRDRIAAFAMGAVRQAAAFLGLSAAEQRLVESMRQRLEAQLA
ncbi:MAG: hypothetical protein IPJ65_20790 [Archangiaceae bacterium]|nr:hypothetical protein [Archangiaceae bacterium]